MCLASYPESCHASVAAISLAPHACGRDETKQTEDAICSRKIQGLRRWCAEPHQALIASQMRSVLENDASTAHLEEDLWEQRSQNEWWYDRQNVWRLLLLTRWELQQNRKSSVLAQCSWSRYHACQGQDDMKGSGWCIP